MVRSLILSVLLLSLGSAALAEDGVLLRDNFSQSELKQRRAARGPWKVADGAITCTMDLEIYKQAKDHGPIVFYTLDVKDAVMRYQFKADGVKQTVFTANADGHVFRFRLNEEELVVLSFDHQGEEKKPIILGRESVKLVPGEWIPVEVALRGDKATVKVGDKFEKTYQNAALDKAKKNFSVGFAFGTMSLRDVVIEK